MCSECVGVCLECVGRVFGVCSKCVGSVLGVCSEWVGSVFKVYNRRLSLSMYEWAHRIQFPYKGYKL